MAASKSPASPPVSPPRTVRPAGLILVIAGLALIALSMFAVDWVEAKFSDGGVPYFEVSERVLSSNAQQVVNDPNGFAVSYFAVLGLLMFVLVAVLALSAALPGGGGKLRLVSVLAVLLGAALLGVATRAVADTAQLMNGPTVAGVGYLTVFLGVLVGGGRR